MYIEQEEDYLEEGSSENLGDDDSLEGVAADFEQGGARFSVIGEYFGSKSSEDMQESIDQEENQSMPAAVRLPIPPIKPKTNRPQLLNLEEVNENTDTELLVKDDIDLFKEFDYDDDTYKID